jgi:hypothetical protein
MRNVPAEWIKLSIVVSFWVRKLYSSYNLFRPTLATTHLPIQRVPVALPPPPPEIKRPGCEADHSRPSSAKGKNTCSYTTIINTPSLLA